MSISTNSTIKAADFTNSRVSITKTTATFSGTLKAIRCGQIVIVSLQQVSFSSAVGYGTAICVMTDYTARRQAFGVVHYRANSRDSSYVVPYMNTSLHIYVNENDNAIRVGNQGFPANKQIDGMIIIPIGYAA